jgi:hypothetical protein
MPAANRLLAMEEGDRGECERVAQEGTVCGVPAFVSVYKALCVPHRKYR